MAVFALIPARGGSKGIPRKNLVRICDRPLIEYSIRAARQAHSVDRVIVSTDDPEIAEISLACGAEVPFLRPAEFANDAASMLSVLCHALEWCEKNSAEQIDALVLLQPTSPLRTARHVDGAVELFFKSGASSVVSVIEVPHQFNPASVMSMKDGILQPYLENDAQPTRRQDKPRVFARNGPAVLVCCPATLKSGELYGPKCVPYMMSAQDSLDIDEPMDIEQAEWLMKRRCDEG